MSLSRAAEVLGIPQRTLRDDLRTVGAKCVNPPGRPEHKPTPELRRVVENLTKMGLTQDQIAKAIEISDVSLRKFYPDEIARGMVALHAAVGSVFVTKCLGGTVEEPDWRKADTAALIHYVRTRMGWTERRDIEFSLGQGRDFENI